MKRKLKNIIKNLKVVILLISLVLAVVAIYPNPSVEGVAIRNIIQNSSASIAGIQSPKPTERPRARERIIAIDNKIVHNTDDYYSYIKTIKVNRTVNIKTNKDFYKLTAKEGDLGLRVYDAPKTNIKKGLDLQGGTRVLLQPAEEVSKDYVSDLILNMEERLNVYGLSDVVLKEVSDLSGNQYILVEIAGTNEEEVKELLAKQGKFEAKIGNKTVFKGGEDITYVCKSADCSGIDPMQGCGRVDGGYACRFRFSISLNPKAAQKQANATKDLEVITEGKQQYLEKKLTLYLDDKEVDELNIGADLKGRAVTDIEISGSGFAATEQEAMFNSLKNMKRLQTILITGSLPIKLDIVKTDSISPLLGEEFIKNALFIGLLAIIAVSVVIFIRYRKLGVSVPLLFTLMSEVILILGVASLIGWNLDLAAIAGIIIAVGTGVDHQIIITDETLKGEISRIFDWKRRIKNAFFIIMGAYFTTVVAMIPLLSAGAGLIKGFAITTTLGVSIGVFITRPAYAAVIEILLKD